MLYSFLIVLIIFFNICHSLKTTIPSNIISNSRLKAFGETTKEPITSFEKKVDSKLLIGASVLALGTVGKKYSDGPVFNENVNLNGKNIVITGANTGLGKETAIKLAALGANLLLLCKSKERGDSAVNDIKSITGSNSIIQNIVMDLGDLKSVQKAANEVEKRIPKIDVLLNNAGIMALPKRELTKDSIEAHMGVNHFGHFALTSYLLPLVDKNQGRIISVSSQAHRFGKDFRDDIMLENSYDPWVAYGNSKLANILFINTLTEKLKSNPKYSNIFCASLHPGLCRTDLGRYFFGDMKDASPLVQALASPLTLVSKSAQQGAQTQIFLSASTKLNRADSGKFYDNSAVADRAPLADNKDLASYLWLESEKRTGTNPHLI